MPITGIIFAVVGVVLLITSWPHWVVGAVCLVIGLGLIAYALSARDKDDAPSAPSAGS